MTDTRTTGSTQVEDLLSRRNVDRIHSSQDTGSQFTSERIPHSVLNLLGGQLRVRRWRLDGDTLLSVDGVSRYQVSGDEEMFFTLYREFGESASLLSTSSDCVTPAVPADTRDDSKGSDIPWRQRHQHVDEAQE